MKYLHRHVFASRSSRRWSNCIARDDHKRYGELRRADITALTAAGWRAPEVFTAKGRDGKTDIWGVIERPANFDASKKYPVIEKIYAGPQGPVRAEDVHPNVQPLTELGFIVAQMDGMGTNERFARVSRRRVPEPGRRRIPRSNSVASSGRCEISLVRPHSRRHFRHLCGRAEFDGRAAVPSGVL